MQERQATVEGDTFPLPDPFHVLATANPIEYEGTYPLPEAQLDRFLMRVSFGYPTADEEYDVVQRRLERQHEEVDLALVTDSAGLRAMQAAVETVTMDESVSRYCVELAASTRQHKDVLTGSSPARLSRPCARCSWVCGDPGPRLRDPRGRQGGRPPGALAPDHGQARAVDDPGERASRGGRRPGFRPDAPRPRAEMTDNRSRWRPTSALARSLTVAGVGVGLALTLGRPALVVIVAPLLVVGALGLLHKPQQEPRVHARIGHVQLHEGQGTRTRLEVFDEDDVEVVTRVMGQVPYVALHPAEGAVAYRSGQDRSIEISPRRWGSRLLGAEKVAMMSPWAGYRWGPASIPAHEMYVLPTLTHLRTLAEAPQPIGLIGAHRSRRDGDGTEFSSIRAFHSGDRLRRINWRVSLRQGTLHVESTRAEEDTAVLLIVDAMADYGISEGVGGQESALDVTVRAAAAVAEQYLQGGDRVSLRVLSPGGEYAGYGTGTAHLRRILGLLARVRPGLPRDVADRTRSTSGQRPGASWSSSARCSPRPWRVPRSGLSAVVCRSSWSTPCLPAPPPSSGPTATRAVADLAWRMRLLDRSDLLSALASAGCPVVPWNGPRTVEEVLRRLARRTQLPRVGWDVIRAVHPSVWVLRTFVVVGLMLALYAAAPEGFVPSPFVRWWCWRSHSAPRSSRSTSWARSLSRSS